MVVSLCITGIGCIINFLVSDDVHLQHTGELKRIAAVCLGVVHQSVQIIMRKDTDSSVFLKMNRGENSGQ
jgi:hypothetical protein